MKVPFLLTVHTLLRTLAFTRATNPGNPQAIVSMVERPDDPYPLTVDVGTYVMHHCHYDCILRYHYKPVSPKCTSCMKTCIDKWKKAYYNVVGYDASIESAREKHKVCLWCGKFSEEHMLDTTWMMCNFPQPSPEGVQECRDKLWNEFKTPQPVAIADVASYVIHLCHYLCIFYKGPPSVEPRTPRCTGCMRACRDQEMKRLRSEVSLDGSVDDNDRHEKCIDCEEFDDDHIRETTMNICHYPHRHPYLGKTPENCTATIELRYEARKERLGIRSAGDVTRVMHY